MSIVDELEAGKYYELRFKSGVLNVIRCDENKRMTLIYSRRGFNAWYEELRSSAFEEKDAIMGVREMSKEEQKRWAKYELFNGSEPMEYT